MWSILITSPISQDGSFVPVLSDQRTFTVIAIVLIGVIAAIFIAFIVILNRKLHKTVRVQDKQIKTQFDDLQLAYERLTEQDKIKDEFINIAAHELRTPVLPIILSAEGLAEELDTNNSKVDIILRNAKRINKLTNDILDVSRIKSNTFKLQKDKVNIRKLIEEAIQDVLFKTAANKDPDLKFKFESKLSPENEEITVDKGRLNQVLSNLLDNAVNFTDRGTITVTLQQKNGNIEIRVADTGKGIDPAVKPKLFEKFVTKSDKAKGTGLGLYLCKAIVEAHGGRIWAEENVQEGKGTIFALTLPASV
jgi:signal transduction histidine kinase